VPQAHRTHEEVLEVLHRQGSELITVDALRAHAALISDYEGEGGECYPCAAMANGVRWFYDRERRPPGPNGPKKALAPEGIPRQLLGSLEPGADPVLFEGERDWLAAASIGIKSALCVGGATNLDDAQIAALAPSSNVVVLFDADEPGIHAAQLVAAQLVEVGCRSVKVVRIPLAGADFSDWIQGKAPDQALEAALHLIQHAAKFGKRDAKRVRREQSDAKDATKPKEVDEFIVGGDLVTSIWKPGDPTKPHAVEQPGTALFAHFDAAATKRSGLLVVNELRRWESTPPEQDPDVPSIYAGQQQEHLQEKPPVMVPLGGDTFQKRIMVVPSAAKEHGSSEGLFDDLVQLVDDYFVVDVRFIHAMVAYVLMTYRYRDAGYEVVPYIRVVGQAGSGKTRFLRVMRELCFRTIFVAGIRPTHLYRILDYFPSGVTMIFEEFNLADSSAEAREYVNLLNAGNQQGTFVPRMAGHQFSELEWMPLFSPKVLTTTNDFANEGLIRRCFTGRVGQLPIPPEKVHEALPDDFYARAADLRCRLLGWRFAKFGQPVNADAAQHRGDIDVGVWQNYFPTVAMIPAVRPRSIEMVLSLAHDQATDLATSQGANPISRVLEGAVFVANADQHRAWTQDVLDHVSEFDPRGQWNLEVVRRCLRGSGLKLQRSSKTIDGHQLFDYYVAVDGAFIECLRTHGLEVAAANEGTRLSKAAKEVM